MGARANLLAPGGFGGFGGGWNPTTIMPPRFDTPYPTSSSNPWWVDLINTGIGVWGGLGFPGLPRPTGILPGGFPGGGAPQIQVASIAAALAGFGLRVVGTVIRGAASAWARVPAALKTAAAALGLTFLADAAGDLLFGGDENGTRRRRRGKGITAAELRGFKKVGTLLRNVGMRPKLGTRATFRKAKSCR